MTCDMRRCRAPIEVRAYDDLGQVIDELCKKHALEIVDERIEALRRFKLVDSGRALLTIKVVTE